MTMMMMMMMMMNDFNFCRDLEYLCSLQEKHLILNYTGVSLLWLALPFLIYNENNMNNINREDIFSLL